MHARSALFDLYGDHLSFRQEWAPIAGIVRLLAPLDVAAPAVRTAVSRMVREGWLLPAEVDGQRGYAATPKARTRLASARARIYRTGTQPWDGRWHVVTLEHASDRATRTRVAAGLGFLGYARMSGDTWVAPRAGEGLDDVLAAEGLGAHCFRSRYEGDGARLAADLWDLEALGSAYERFIRNASASLGGPGPDARGPASAADPDPGLDPDLDPDLDPASAADLDPDPETAFTARSRLVHEWRKFLFRDPGLPAEVLPAAWPGHEAARLFDQTAAALLPRSRSFVDRCLAGSADRSPMRRGRADER